MERRTFGWRFRFLARHAARTGEPIVRTMEYEFPHAGFAKPMTQFMLGPKTLTLTHVPLGRLPRYARTETAK